MTAKLLPIVLNQLATLLFGIVGVIMITHMVPQDVYAPYALFLTLTQVGYLLSHSGLINHTSRYWQREHGSRGSYVRFLWRESLRHGKILAIGMFLCAAFFAVRKGAYWLLLFPLLWFGNWMVALQAMASVALNAGGKLWSVCLLGVVGAGTRALLPLIWVMMAGASLVALLSGYFLHGVIALGLILWIFADGRRARRPENDQRNQWRHELAVFGRPFVWMGVGGWLLLYADRWIVRAFFGVVETADYSLASQLAAIVPGFAAASLLQLFFPSVFRSADAARTPDEWRLIGRRCDAYTAILVVCSLAGLGALQALAPLLVGWIISDTYQSSLALLFAAGSSVLSAQANQFQYLLLQGQHNSRGMAQVMLIVSGIKTLGSVAAAAVSWEIFLAWQVTALAPTLVLGRQLIRRKALKAPAHRLAP